MTEPYSRESFGQFVSFDFVTRPPVAPVAGVRDVQQSRGVVLKSATE